MTDKLCSNCGTTLLVGLQYCPGCLCAIDGAAASRYEEISEESVGADSFYVDLETVCANLLYPVKAGFCRLFRLREPKSPPVIPSNTRGYRARFGKREREPEPASTLSFAFGYTRVVCPKCMTAHKAPMELEPSQVVMCNSCTHTFPAAFAAEYRKGLDLHCSRCGVTTFCVSGHRVKSCPNCKLISINGVRKAKIKAMVGAGVLVSVFLALLINSV